MQPLRDYLNESSLQYESILDPDQNKVMSRMADATDDMIRKRIREYCTYDRQKDARDEQWAAADPNLEIVKIDKDNKGWYIETENTELVDAIYDSDVKSVYDYCSSKGQKIDAQKGFLVEDMGIYFRWRKHKGSIEIWEAQALKYTEGLPEELECLHLHKCCQKSGHFIVRNKIKLMILSNIRDTKISGNGCKNIVIDPGNFCENITVRKEIKMHHPKRWDEYQALIEYIKSH